MKYPHAERVAGVTDRDPFVSPTYVLVCLLGIPTAFISASGAFWALVPCALLLGWAQIGGI